MIPEKNPTSYTAKRKARRFTLQGLYEWQMTQNAAHLIEAHTRAENAMHKVDMVYYNHLLKNCIAQASTLDELIVPALDRELDSLDGVERAILRMGMFEMLNELQIPYRVVIDEAVELARDFGATDSHKYINGVLDRLAQTHRAPEVAAHQKSAGTPPA